MRNASIILHLLIGVFILLIPWTKLELLERITWAEVTFVVLLVVVAAHLAKSKARLHDLSVSKPFLVIVACWLIAVLLSGFGAADKTAYLFEAGGMVYLGALGVALSALLASDEISLARAIRWLFLSLAIVSLIGCIGLGKGLFTSGVDRFFFSRTGKLIASFERSGQLAGFLVLFIPLAWELCIASKRVKRVLFGALLLAMLAGLIATASRSGLAALLVVGAIYLIWYLAKRKFKLVLGSAIAGVALIGLLFLLSPYVEVASRVTTVLETFFVQGQFTDPFRLKNWGQAIQVFRTAPITGCGLGSFALTYGHEVHNTYLATLAEMGLIGAAALALLFGYLATISYQNIRLATRILPTWIPYARGLLMGLIAEYVFATQHVMVRSRHLWLVFGMIIGMNSLLRKLKENGKTLPLNSLRPSHSTPQTNHIL